MLKAGHVPPIAMCGSKRKKRPNLLFLHDDQLMAALTRSTCMRSCPFHIYNRYRRR